MEVGSEGGGEGERGKEKRKQSSISSLPLSESVLLLSSPYPFHPSCLYFINQVPWLIISSRIFCSYYSRVVTVGGWWQFKGTEWLVSHPKVITYQSAWLRRNAFWESQLSNVVLC